MPARVAALPCRPPLAPATRPALLLVLLFLLLFVGGCCPVPSGALRPPGSETALLATVVAQRGDATVVEDAEGRRLTLRPPLRAAPGEIVYVRGRLEGDRVTGATAHPLTGPPTDPRAADRQATEP